jgi:GNAT superfamily N-acetyltransferase
MKFNIREAVASDMPSVMDLIKELAAFERQPEAVEVRVEDLLKYGFGPGKRFHCFVGETVDGIAGMALIYPRFSTWKGPVIHLEDLIVTEKARGTGLGSALLEAVIRHSHAQGVKRVCWEVLDWNEAAIRFYEGKGAKVLRDWDLVHLDAAGIEHIINNL